MSDQPGVTGDPDVDAVLADLEALPLEAEPDELLPRLAAAHDALTDRLRAVEE